jgi:hypothetical protein
MFGHKTPLRSPAWSFSLPLYFEHKPVTLKWCKNPCRHLNTSNNIFSEMRRVQYIPQYCNSAEASQQSMFCNPYKASSGPRNLLNHTCRLWYLRLMPYSLVGEYHKQTLLLHAQSPHYLPDHTSRSERSLFTFILSILHVFTIFPYVLN